MCVCLGDSGLVAAAVSSTPQGFFLEKFTWGGKMEYLNFVGGQGLKLLKLYLFML